MARPQLPTSDAAADVARRVLSSSTRTTTHPTFNLLIAKPTIPTHCAPSPHAKKAPEVYVSSCSMASTASLSAVAARPLSVAGLKKPLGASFQPLPRARPAARMAVRASASMKERATAGLTAAAMVAAMVLPDVAEAAQGGLTPSLKNFLLSIVSGGVVLVALVGAVVAVSNFDPVKRT
ncbi:hypothetical protein E2562_020438 [Oryza meyeriana var. granulata]|uniref:Uncharacterized protein n=1 Tax=Oryza meyeriana var. granulata TaxID=110450 RepID=A0A6G1D7B4_9ORYZ|nr:hypothetical protein E2562_020438 [Oryza meyeriana var. granulata]